MKKDLSLGLCLLCMTILPFAFNSCRDDYSLLRGDVVGTAEPAGTKLTFDRGDKKFSTVSDSNLYFKMSNLETGIYNITLEKKGYFTYKKFGFSFHGGPAPEYLASFRSFPRPDHVTITLDSVASAGNLTIRIWGSCHREADQLSTFEGIRWFISDRHGVSSGNFLQTYFSGLNLTNSPDFEDYIDLKPEVIENSRFIYIKGYAGVSSCDYFDWDKYTEVYAITGRTTAEIKFEIPSEFYSE